MPDLQRLKYLFSIGTLTAHLHWVCWRIRSIICSVLSILKVQEVVKHYSLFLASQILPDLIFLSLPRSYWFKHALIFFLLFLEDVHSSAYSSEFEVLVWPSSHLGVLWKSIKSSTEILVLLFLNLNHFNLKCCHCRDERLLMVKCSCLQPSLSWSQ